MVSLVDTSLSGEERALVEEFASELRSRLGQELSAVSTSETITPM